MCIWECVRVLVALLLLTCLWHIRLHAVLRESCRSTRALPALRHVRAASRGALLRWWLRCRLQRLRRSKGARMRCHRLTRVHLSGSMSVGSGAGRGLSISSRECWRCASRRRSWTVQASSVVSSHVRWQASATRGGHVIAVLSRLLKACHISCW